MKMMINVKWLSLCVAFLCAVNGCAAENKPSGGPAVSLEDFKRTVEDKAGFVLVDFWAPRCGPCRRMAPVFEKLGAEFNGRITFTKVDVDQSSEVSEKYKITGIPALILFKDGKVHDQKVGFQGEDQLRDWLNKQTQAAPVAP